MIMNVKYMRGEKDEQNEIYYPLRAMKLVIKRKKVLVIFFGGRKNEV
jgi:hypothetical protein